MVLGSVKEVFLSVAGTIKVRSHWLYSPILNTSANLAWAIFEKSECLDHFQNIVFCWPVGRWF